ncbi:hypothetical protein ACFLVX_05455 [Chloroflexota bacterium]
MDTLPRAMVKIEKGSGGPRPRPASRRLSLFHNKPLPRLSSPLNPQAPHPPSHHRSSPNAAMWPGN